MNFIIHLALVTGIFVCAVLVFVWSPQEVNDSFLLLIILGIMFTFSEFNGFRNY